MLTVLALAVAVVSRLDGGRADTEKDTRMRIGITVCKDRAGNYIPCPPNIREQIGR